MNDTTLTIERPTGMTEPPDEARYPLLLEMLARMSGREIEERLTFDLARGDCRQMRRRLEREARKRACERARR